MVIVEAYGLCGQKIDIRGLDLGAKATAVAEAEVVSDDDEEVGPLGAVGRHGGC
jgi:hypothetical protein